MALLQDLIQQIDDPALKERILQETNKLLKRYHSLMQQKRNGRAIKESLTSSEVIVNTLFRRYKRNSPDNTFSAEMSLRY